ncbi:hypothetical protein JXA05_04620, partial [Candidatus Peregrinibacteria bacterium]|nr:hypothetical protein [Candidatus Peregrinibacteria bacterium]
MTSLEHAAETPKGSRDKIREALLLRMNMSKEMREAPIKSEIGSTRVILERLSEEVENDELIKVIAPVAHIRLTLQCLLDHKNNPNAIGDIISGEYLMAEKAGGLEAFRDYVSKMGRMISGLLANHAEYDSIFEGTLHERAPKFVQPYLNQKQANERLKSVENTFSARLMTDVDKPIVPPSNQVTDGTTEEVDSITPPPPPP